jgi:hypothetical protein
MNKTILAKCISYILSPVTFSLFVPFLVISKQTNDISGAIKWTIFSAIFILMGLLVVIVGKKHGTFSDLDVSNREERKKFYLFLWPLLICYLIASVFFRGMFFSLSIISVGIVIGLFLFEFINLKIKASVHIGVATAFVIMLGILYGWHIFAVSVLFVPLIAWSRVVLKRHTIPEVFTGAVLGTIITILTFLIAQFIVKL